MNFLHNPIVVGKQGEKYRKENFWFPENEIFFFFPLPILFELENVSHARRRFIRISLEIDIKNMFLLSYSFFCRLPLFIGFTYMKKFWDFFPFSKSLC